MKRPKSWNRRTKNKKDTIQQKSKWNQQQKEEEEEETLSANGCTRRRVGIGVSRISGTTNSRWHSCSCIGLPTHTNVYNVVVAREREREMSWKTKKQSNKKSYSIQIIFNSKLRVYCAILPPLSPSYIYKHMRILCSFLGTPDKLDSLIFISFFCFSVKVTWKIC